jgi:hypothetical protein
MTLVASSPWQSDSKFGWRWRSWIFYINRSTMSLFINTGLSPSLVKSNFVEVWGPFMCLFLHISVMFMLWRVLVHVQEIKRCYSVSLGSECYHTYLTQSVWLDLFVLVISGWVGFHVGWQMIDNISNLCCQRGKGNQWLTS